MSLGLARDRSRTRQHRAGSFSPRLFPDLLAWWDASRILGLSHGDPVDAWADQSGSGRDATQGTSAKRPGYQTNMVNGLPCVRFDGVDDALTGSTGLAANSAMTFLLVERSWATSAYGSILSVGTAASAEEIGVMADAGGTNLAVSNFLGPTATAGDRYTTTACTDWHVASLVYAPTATPVLRKNGGSALGYTTAVGDWSAANIYNGASNPPFALGAAAGGTQTPHAVDIAVAMVYGRALSDAERSQLERWLGARYAITVT